MTSQQLPEHIPHGSRTLADSGSREHPPRLTAPANFTSVSAASDGAGAQGFLYGNVSLVHIGKRKKNVTSRLGSKKRDQY